MDIAQALPSRYIVKTISSPSHWPLLQNFGAPFSMPHCMYVPLISALSHPSTLTVTLSSKSASFFVKYLISLCAESQLFVHALNFLVMISYD
jgi:hypothetical protein